MRHRTSEADDSEAVGDDSDVSSDMMWTRNCAASRQLLTNDSNFCEQKKGRNVRYETGNVLILFTIAKILMIMI